MRREASPEIPLRNLRLSGLREQLDDGLVSLGIQPSFSLTSKLEQYLALLRKWNSVYNLTAIREPSRLISHHLLDSLSVLSALNATTILDVGSGAGFPGIPLALARPELNVTLLDSNHKKGAFLRQAAVELSLTNIEIQVLRVEHYLPAKPYEIVISRAYSDLAGFAEAAARFCAPGGMLLAMKGIYPDEELTQLPACVHLENVLPLFVPGLSAARHLIVMRPA